MLQSFLLHSKFVSYIPQLFVLLTFCKLLWYCDTLSRCAIVDWLYIAWPSCSPRRIRTALHVIALLNRVRNEAQIIVQIQLNPQRNLSAQNQNKSLLEIIRSCLDHEKLSGRKLIAQILYILINKYFCKKNPTIEVYKHFFPFSPFKKMFNNCQSTVFI